MQLLVLKLKSIFKFLFIFDIKLIYFFSDTLLGYGFYIFSVIYGFFGCTNDNCNITHSLAAIFAVFMMGLVFQTYILLKIPFTRNYLENLVGKNYLQQYLGKYTGSDAIGKMFKYFGPTFGLVVAETWTANQEAQRFEKAAKIIEENFFNDNKLRNHIPSDEEYKQMCTIRNNYIDKAAHAKGIITRGISRGFSASNLQN